LFSSRCLSLLLLAGGCQVGAEIGWSLGPLDQVAPLSARWLDGQLELRAVLVGWEGQPLGAQDRVRAGAQVVRLGGLGPGQVTGSLEVVETGGRRVTVTAASQLGHSAAGSPLRLALVLDNGTATAAADPGLERVAAARELVSAVLCSAEERCPYPGAQVALVVLQGGAARVVVGLTDDVSALHRGLDGLAGRLGGEAPLWDGLLQAATAARASAEGSPAVILYTVGVQGASQASAAQAAAALGTAPTARLLAISPAPRGSAVSEGLLAAATASGGALLDGDRPLRAALREARCALAGSWALRLQAPGVPPLTGARLQGQLGLRVGGELREASVDLPLQVSP